MASPPPRQSSAERTLVELLDEKQEPFLLDVYLLENGYCPSNVSDPAAISSTCWPTSKSGKNQSKLARQGLRRQIEGLLRSVFALLIHSKEVKISSASCAKKAKALDGGKHGVPGRVSEAAGMSGIAAEEPHQSSSSAGGTDHISNEMLCCTKVDADRWECVECSKQLSPVSVLDLTSEDSDSPTYYEPSKAKRAPAPVTGIDQMQAKGAEVFQQFMGSDSSPEKKATRTTAWQFLDTMKPEEVKMVTRSAQSDFLDTMRGWIQIEAEVAEIGAKIAGAILDDINESAISDILTISCTLKRV